jgi:hypothetical protein
VPKLILDVLEVLPLLEEEACVSVAQVMEADLLEPYGLDRWQEMTVHHVALVDRLRVLVGRHQVKVTRQTSELPLFQL